MPGKPVKQVAGVDMVQAPPTSWVPTRKWFVNIATLGATLLTSWVTAGWSDAQWIALIGLCLTAVTTYFTPNAKTE